ncbi:class I SAM-dependent methyltransferase [Saccharopolyspora indica]|uniref:class I SAM-dependent methyltransferase n=1 Tax=Saccharopolyspora indica TaxID=1229659 RepID=UPI0022EB71BC|nr:class I SAM-dependent methyltransferase [Saccharopolyspora indica]MDA3647015.1 class I SAM-dependent methyltransferase [Saccharopolyspora indica]
MNLQDGQQISACRLCGGHVRQVLDFGRQPVSNAFIRPEDLERETYFELTVGLCENCSMVQQLNEVARDRMFHHDYPYRSSLSSLMSKHFAQVAQQLVETELLDSDSFVVEIGSNDGILLSAVSEEGIRHLGVDPSRGAANVAAERGVRVMVDFFEENTARRIRAEHGPADVIFSANTTSHIAYLDSVLRGVELLLAPGGVFVVEDRYLADIIANNYFDQIYDEHFYLFSVRSVAALAARSGLELVDAERLPVHGGSIRYTIARPGTRPVRNAVPELIEEERAAGLADAATFRGFATNIDRVGNDLVTLLRELRAEGKSVLGYGATSKSATVTNYFDIGPELVPYVCDTTPEKHGRVSPGSHIPVRPAEAFQPYPDYALLFAWNHAEEIMAKERGFRESGGRWILYVPDVHIA